MILKVNFEFELDFGSIFVFTKRTDPQNTLKPIAQNSLPAPVLPRELTCDDYPANNKAVNCSKCGHRINKLGGYRDYFGPGFFCENCQYLDNRPLRVKKV